MKITDKQYKKIAKLMLKKGFTPETAFEALKSAGFKVNLKGETLSGIYASRVIAIMHEHGSDDKVLEL